MHIKINDPLLAPAELQGFCVGWVNPLDPETLWKALKGSYRYVIAGDDDGKVIGFANAISDGVFAAYIPMIEVLPEHQGKGVGTALMRTLLEELRDIWVVDLMCDDDVKGFYERLGMYRLSGMRVRRG
ncbi:MAG: GNAT family N-acetyltransferase [Bacillota bacterium]